jgi:outer membrane protein OmpA-like peptidoglycan-associated protein
MQTKPYKGYVTIEPVLMEQRYGKLRLELDIVLKNFELKSTENITLTPVLVGGEKKTRLPEVELKGRDEYLLYERELALMSAADRKKFHQPYMVEQIRRKRSGVLNYHYELEYESWMADAVVEFDMASGGQTFATERPVIGTVSDPTGTVNVAPVGYKVVPHPAYVRSEVGEGKQHAVEVEVFLDFGANETGIREDYKNNTAELAKIHRMISEIRGNPNIRVNSLSIIGYASPEGTLASNKIVSERRANALKDYLVAQYDFPLSLYHIAFGGENWDGLVEALGNIKMQYKDEVLDIIDRVSIEEGRETRLMELHDGKPYRYMLEHIFPGLRVATCKVEYSIRNFELEEAREIIKTRPRELNLNEMFLVANSYPEGSPEFVDVFETAVRMYPQSEVANLNAATSALMRNDLIYARRYLDRVDPELYPAEYNNTMGLIFLLEEDFGKAEEYLGKAAGHGLKAARLNLEELKKVKSN